MSRGLGGGGGGGRSRGGVPRLAGWPAAPPPRAAVARPGPPRGPGSGAGARCARPRSDRRRAAASAAMIPPEPQPHQPPPPAPPNHVVTTIENLPAEGSGGGSLSASSRAGVRQRIRKVLNR